MNKFQESAVWFAGHLPPWERLIHWTDVQYDQRVLTGPDTSTGGENLFYDQPIKGSSKRKVTGTIVKYISEAHLIIWGSVVTKKANNNNDLS